MVVALFAGRGAEAARPVLVYLANEPAPTAAYKATLDRLSGWLESSPSQADRQLGEAIREDLQIFPAAVASELAAIRRHLDRIPGAVIVTNRLLQAHTVLVKKPGDIDLAPQPFTVPLSPTSLGESSPLATYQNLDAILEFVAAQFPPAEHDFVIVVHSHGDQQYALTPRVGLESDGLTREQFLDRVHHATTVFVERYGVTTAEFLALLERHHQSHGLQTSLLVLHTCEGTVESRPTGVAKVLVAASGGSLPHDAVNYDAVLSAPGTLPEAFVSTLVPVPFELATAENNARRARSRLLARVTHVSLYCVPLALWIGAAMWFRRLRRVAGGSPLI